MFWKSKWKTAAQTGEINGQMQETVSWPWLTYGNCPPFWADCGGLFWSDDPAYERLPATPWSNCGTEVSRGSAASRYQSIRGSCRRRPESESKQHTFSPFETTTMKIKCYLPKRHLIFSDIIDLTIRREENLNWIDLIMSSVELLYSWIQLTNFIQLLNWSETICIV